MKILSFILIFSFSVHVFAFKTVKDAIDVLGVETELSVTAGAVDNFLIQCYFEEDGVFYFDDINKKVYQGSKANPFFAFLLTPFGFVSDGNMLIVDAIHGFGKLGDLDFNGIIYSFEVDVENKKMNIKMSSTDCDVNNPDSENCISESNLECLLKN